MQLISTIIEQFPVVFPALNAGFLQTLRLFLTTLVGALPLGLIISFGSMSRFRPLSKLTKVVVWIVRGSPLMLQLLIIYYLPGLLGKQLLVAAALDNTAVLQNHDRICVADGGKPVCNDKYRASLHQAVHSFFDQSFGTGVNTAGCLVQDQNRRVCNRCTCNRQQLPLSL